MSVKSSPAAKRKRVTMQQAQPDAALGSLIKDLVASRPPVKNVLVIDVGGTSVKILAHRANRSSIVSLRTDAHSSADGLGGEKACRGLDV
jgi:hypothetical protein